MKKGFRKPRKVRPTEKDLPKGYDSNWNINYTRIN